MEPRREVPAACALSDSGGVALAASICAFTGKTGTDGAEFVPDRGSVFSTDKSSKLHKCNVTKAYIIRLARATVRHNRT